MQTLDFKFYKNILALCLDFDLMVLLYKKHKL